MILNVLLRSSASLFCWKHLLAAAAGGNCFVESGEWTETAKLRAIEIKTVRWEMLNHGVREPFFPIVKLAICNFLSLNSTSRCKYWFNRAMAGEKSDHSCIHWFLISRPVNMLFGLLSPGKMLVKKKKKSKEGCLPLRNQNKMRCLYPQVTVE